jgi:uncharacterized membrane protein
VKKIVKKITSYFLQGLLYIAPIGITIWILYSVFINIDSLFDGVLPYDIPGLGIIITIIIVAILGYLGKIFVTTPITQAFEKLLEKAPIIKLIYSSIKDLLKAFVGKEKKFSEPVLVKVNNISNLEKVGFVTNKDLADIGVEGKKVAVYFPHSYAFSGELYIVPSENIKPIDKASAEVMKFIVSGGVSKN